MAAKSWVAFASLAALCAGCRSSEQAAGGSESVESGVAEASSALDFDDGALKGTLADKSFSVQKGILRKLGHQHNLDFWNFASGGRCQQQYAPGEGQLFLSFLMNDGPGKYQAAREYTEADLRPVYKQSPSGRASGRLRLVFDVIDEAKGVARGRLALRVDERTKVGGAFEIAYCDDGVVARAEGGEIHGVRWGAPPPASQLPRAAAKAELGGKSATIERVMITLRPKIEVSAFEPSWVLHLYTAAPPDPCAADFGGGIATPGFVLGLGPDLRSGLELAGAVQAGDVKGGRYAVARLPGTVIQEGRAGYYEVAIDRVDRSKKRVFGRVYAAFTDAGKSMVVGAFDAALCKTSK